MTKINRFQKVFVLGEDEPDFHNPDLSLNEACDRAAARMKAAGATALQLNFITTPYHPSLFSHPDEVYLFFGNYAASLDMFAESEYSRGLYPRFYLEENLHRLECLSKAAARHGLSGVLYIGEPRFAHPGLFDRFPRWRGPRVDNPNCSKTPLYALDTDLPEVRDHYAQMLRQVLAVAPNTEDAVIFCHDSGAGFSHSWALYAGPNGPYRDSRFFGHESNVGKRVVEFCAALRTEALSSVPGFDVTLTSQFSQPERVEIQNQAGEGVHIAVWGKESRTGGMEDQWAWYQCGPARLKEIGFEEARIERIAEFEDRVSVTVKAGRQPRVVMPAPNEHYFSLTYVPNPWEQLENMERCVNWGVDQMIFKGLTTSDEDVPYNINQASCARFLADSRLSAGDAVQDAVTSWVPQAAVDPLLRGFRFMETAVRFRPNYNVCADRDVTFLPGPLTPDPSRLTRQERAHYWLPVHDTLEVLRGSFFYIPNLGKEHLDYIFSQFESSTFPAIENALACFEEAEKAGGGACATQQIKHASLYRCLQRGLLHYAQMAVHWREVGGVPAPSPGAIVDAEIENTRDWLLWLGDRPRDCVRLGAQAGVVYGPSRHLTANLGKRIDLMQKHRDDPVRAFNKPFFRDVHSEGQDS